MPKNPPDWITDAQEIEAFRFYVRHHGKHWVAADLDLVCAFIQLVCRIRKGQHDNDKDLTQLRNFSKHLGIDAGQRMKKKNDKKPAANPIGDLVKMTKKDRKVG